MPEEANREPVEEALNRSIARRDEEQPDVAEGDCPVAYWGLITSRVGPMVRIAFCNLLTGGVFGQLGSADQIHSSLLRLIKPRSLVVTLDLDGVMRSIGGGLLSPALSVTNVFGEIAIKQNRSRAELACRLAKITACGSNAADSRSNFAKARELSNIWRWLMRVDENKSDVRLSG
jgi:hypothetical protein